MTKDPSDLLTVPLSIVRRTIVKRLIKSHPRPVSSDDLIDTVYSNVRDGGPMNPRSTLIVHMTYLRRALKQHGWTIPRAKSGVTALYRLEPLP